MKPIRILLLAAVCLIAAPSARGQMCLGDADLDDRVTVDEIVLVVNNALSACTADSGLATRVVTNYADLLFYNYRDAEEAAERLRQAVDELVANPSLVLLEAAKSAWLAARPVYLQTEMARFYEGPIDDAEDGPEGRINAWPLDESYIDYVIGQPTAGIINDPGAFPQITKEVLSGLNEQGGEENVATGFHAVEFLLWGQDLRVDGNGVRPHTDYITGAGGTAANQARRGQYLKAVAELLVDDIRSVRQEWDPRGGNNYRAELVALDTQIALGRILTGVGTLSGFELSNERMNVALETKDQEDEHSCFSDNTHNDHRFDELGIQNVYLGRYGRHDGPGIDELVAAVDASLDTATQTRIEAAITAIRGIPVPFDQAIQGTDADPGRQAIIGAVEALREQTAKIEEVAVALDVDITTTQ